MTEITQADHNAAEKAQWDAVVRVDSLAEAFARHREQAAAEERAKIVKWLRGFATDYADDLADILEADETFTHPDNV